MQGYINRFNDIHDSTVIYLKVKTLYAHLMGQKVKAWKGKKEIFSETSDEEKSK